MLSGNLGPSIFVLRGGMQGIKKVGYLKNLRTTMTKATFTPELWVPTGPWSKFDAMRRSLNGRYPWTSDAKQLIQTALWKLWQEGHDPAAVLEQSVMMGWRGVFPLRTNGQKANGDGWTIGAPAGGRYCRKCGRTELWHKSSYRKREPEPGDDGHAFEA